MATRSVNGSVSGRHIFCREYMKVHKIEWKDRVYAYNVTKYIWHMMCDEEKSGWRKLDRIGGDSAAYWYHWAIKELKAKDEIKNAPMNSFTKIARGIFDGIYNAIFSDVWDPLSNQSKSASTLLLENESKLAGAYPSMNYVMGMYKLGYSMETIYHKWFHRVMPLESIIIHTFNIQNKH